MADREVYCHENGLISMVLSRVSLVAGHSSTQVSLMLRVSVSVQRTSTSDVPVCWPLTLMHNHFIFTTRREGPAGSALQHS